MLIAMPEPRTDPALLAVARAVDRFKFNWERFLIGWCAAFHVATAVPLAFAPTDQILSAGTAPVLEMASRYVWAVVFLAAGLLAAYLLHQPTPLVQFLAWFTILPLGVVWLLAFTLAVLDGRGNAIGIGVWFFLYGPWAVAGIRVALGKR